VLNDDTKPGMAKGAVWCDMIEFAFCHACSRKNYGGFSSDVSFLIVDQQSAVPPDEIKTLSEELKKALNRSDL